MEKITKKMIYTALVELAETVEFETLTATLDEENVVEIPVETLKEFALKELEQLEKKAAKAKEAAAKKKSEVDALGEQVKQALTSEYEPIADIAARIEDEEATVSKITYRLTKLVAAGIAEKTDLKIKGGEGQKTRTVKGYRLAGEATEEEVIEE